MRAPNGRGSISFRPRSTCSISLPVVSFLSVALAALAGCGDGGQGDAGISDASMTDDRPMARPTDAGLVPCSPGDSCDDGVACTEDSCDSSGFCRNALNHMVCSNGVYCDGSEVCDPLRGCIMGPRETCDDMDVCSIDRCLEETRSCEHLPRDLDLDGDPDFFCEGGGDCDDRDPTRNSSVSEVCGDLVDNDCDEAVDEQPCGRAASDTCAEAFELTGSGSYSLPLGGAAADYELSCAFVSDPDVVATFTLTEAQDVHIEVTNDAFATLEVRTACTDGATALSCNDGFPATLRFRALPAGTYYLIAAAASFFETTSVDFDVTFSPASPPLENETCASATEIPFPAGLITDGSLVGARDDGETRCGDSDTGEIYYRFVIPEPTEAGDTGERDVLVTASTPDVRSLAVQLQTGCGATAVVDRCAYGAPTSLRSYRLPPGEYVLVLERSGSSEPDFHLEVSFLAPTDPPTGDLCSNAAELTPGVQFAGNGTGSQDDVAPSCSATGVDMIHHFRLAEAQDVTIVASAGTTYLRAALSTVCAMPATEVACVAGTPARITARGLAAGDYYLVVEGTSLGAYTVDLTLAPPTMITDVTGNDTCANAFAIPATGGLFRGNTTALTDDFRPTDCGSETNASPDAVYCFTLTARSRIVATTNGSAFDTVVYVLGSTCTGELECDDDGGDGTQSLLDTTLDAGTYTLVVDGYSTNANGAYLLDVSFSPPTT